MAREPFVGREVRYSTCYMCACRCGIQVTTLDGELRFIQGTREHPVNQGVLCAKGSAGIMKQRSPAKLSKPLKRREGAERGAGVFDEIEWDEAYRIVETRLAHIRATDPKQLAFFTGRDQMQALTGLWAQQFGTPNWAAHGGFCSVNMAAAGLYSIGWSFWEFGAPDWDRAKYFLLWGVAEDHSSNPIKIGLDKLKRRGAKFVSVNPIRTGYSAIADEWVPIRPGTDGLLALAIVHVLLTEGHDRLRVPRALHERAVARDRRARYGGQRALRARRRRRAAGVGRASGAGGRRPSGNAQARAVRDVHAAGRPARAVGAVARRRALPRRAVLARSGHRCVRRAGRDDPPARARDGACGVQGNDRAADPLDRRVGPHARQGDRPAGGDVRDARHLRALQRLPDVPRAAPDPDAARARSTVPGNFRARAPYPKPIPPHLRPNNAPAKPDTPLARPPLGFPLGPEDLALDAQGQPLRIDKAYSWESPLAAHGLMHMVIANAVAGDPYPIDTLMLFMANMAWNSAMNTMGTRALLAAKHPDGRYKIPFIVVADAFASETVAFADLVLPDTTYLERYDAISLLDRPISEPDAPADAIRQPLVPLDRDVKPWQEVMVELASRLRFPAFTQPDGTRKFEGYEDFIVRYERAPGIGFLAGWRGEDGKRSLVGAPNPKQWEAYKDNKAFFAFHLPDAIKWHRYANLGYLEFAKKVGFNGDLEPIVMQIYSEPLQRFRLAGQGSVRRAAAARSGGPRAPRALLRSAAVLVSAARDAANGRRRVPAACADPAADDDVPLVGCAERLAAADRGRQRDVRERRHGGGARPRRRRLGVGRVASRQAALPHPHDGGRRAQHRVDVERDRQAGRRVGTRGDGARRPRRASCSIT